MDQVDRSPSPDLHDDDSTLVARSVERDFAGLIAIFDRQLANLPTDDRAARRHIIAARTAAQRGLKLSRDLLSRLEY